MPQQRKIPVRYLPKSLTNRDRTKQLRELQRSRKLYKHGVYHTRKRVTSFNNKKSSHIANARRIYGVDTVTPNQDLAKKTGCSVAALRKIVSKGEGAYFSSGSRPNQTARSWGLARLASAITAGKSAAVDYDILDKGCDHTKRAFHLANKSRKLYGKGRGTTKRTNVTTK